MSLITSDKRKHKQLKAKTCCLSKLGYVVFESNQQPPCVCVCVMIAGSRIGINHREIVGGGAIIYFIISMNYVCLVLGIMV